MDSSLMMADSIINILCTSHKRFFLGKEVFHSMFSEKRFVGHVSAEQYKAFGKTTFAFVFAFVYMSIHLIS